MSNKVYSFLGLIKKAGELSTGGETVLIDLKKERCKLLIIAEDASENTKKKFTDSAKYRNIPYLFFGNKEILGQILGKGEISVAAIKNEGFAKSLMNKVEIENGGEIIDNKD
jgi:ribosomal protein L7Ae-like RNA K-turn-binding protein